MKIVSNDNQTKTNSLDINASLKRSAIVSLNYAKIVSLIAFDASLLRTLWKLSVRIYSWLMRNCNCIVVSSLIAPFFFAVLSLKHFTAQHIDVQIALDNVSRFRCNESICHRLRCERKNGNSVWMEILRRFVLTNWRQNAKALCPMLAPARYISNEKYNWTEHKSLHNVSHNNSMECVPAYVSKGLKIALET